MRESAHRAFSLGGELIVKCNLTDRPRGALTERNLRGVYMRDRKWGPESKKPNHEDWAKCLNLLVPERGIEPPTFALRMRCSTV
jgi:hypothetical protein